MPASKIKSLFAYAYVSCDSRFGLLYWGFESLLINFLEEEASSFEEVLFDAASVYDTCCILVAAAGTATL